MPDFTVIIPHYNIPDLLGRCLRSTPEQDNIEVIVVDDCSPCADRLSELVPELSRSNVRLLHTDRGGSAGRARNVGIRHARGRWLTFMDADDLFTPEAFTLAESQKNSTADILFFQTLSVLSDDLSKPSGRNMFARYFDEYKTTGDETYMRYEFDSTWGKFIRRDLIAAHNIRFDEIRWSNDVYFNACIGVFANSIFVSDQPAYIVTERQGSLTADQSRSYDEWKTRYDVTIRKQALLDTHNIDERGYVFAAYLFRQWKAGNRRLFFREFSRLTLRNRLRVLAYTWRHFFGHHPV